MAKILKVGAGFYVSQSNGLAITKRNGDSSRQIDTWKMEDNPDDRHIAPDVQ